jgi:phospholipid-binding lipoprotein MlaA
LLHASQLLETAALDPYEFLRDAYLQRRRYLVHDGNPPEEEEFREKPKPTSRGPQAPASPMPESSTGSGTAGGKPAVNGETRRHSPEPELAVAAPRARAKGRSVRIWLPDRNY